jgi:CHASE3 domain sensor protein
MDNEQPVTQTQLLAALEANNKQLVQQLRQEFSAEMDRRFEAFHQQLIREFHAVLEKALQVHRDEILDRAQEMVRDAQTELLRGFQSYVDRIESRLQVLEDNESNRLRSIRSRLASLEQDVLQIKAKLLQAGL